MSISAGLYNHPIVRAAIDESHEIVSGWIEGLNPTERQNALSAYLGWDAVTLGERIARALLERSGINEFDLCDFDELEEDSWMLPHNERPTEQALYETWDQLRRDRKEGDRG